ncbi:MAG: RNA polymerase subunit sigma [Phycisphaerales bacterium]|nr:RNA polymerase subunit sigma [Phycisphaerales bacterium]
MPSGANTSLTLLLEAASAGDSDAARQVWERVEPELHRMAAGQIARDGLRAVLRPTSMVAEAYLRLVGPADGNHWANHRHFFAAAAETMRRIRVDRARVNKAAKRGGGAATLALSDQHWASDDDDDRTDHLALDEVLPRLRKESPRAAEVVNLRFYGGHSREEIASMLGISPRTVDNEWRFARSWLFAALSG